jgi:hypothetical protein
MEHMDIPADNADEAVIMLLEFIGDIYDYLGLELPDEFDADIELVNVVDAIRDRKHEQ